MSYISHFRNNQLHIVQTTPKPHIHTVEVKLVQQITEVAIYIYISLSHLCYSCCTIYL